MANSTGYAAFFHEVPRWGLQVSYPFSWRQAMNAFTAAPLTDYPQAVNGGATTMATYLSGTLAYALPLTVCFLIASFSLLVAAIYTYTRRYASVVPLAKLADGKLHAAGRRGRRLSASGGGGGNTGNWRDHEGGVTTRVTSGSGVEEGLAAVLLQPHAPTGAISIPFGHATTSARGMRAPTDASNGAMSTSVASVASYAPSSSVPHPNMFASLFVPSSLMQAGGVGVGSERSAASVGTARTTGTAAAAAVAVELEGEGGTGTGTGGWQGMASTGPSVNAQPQDLRLHAPGSAAAHTQTQTATAAGQQQRRQGQVLGSGEREKQRGGPWRCICTPSVCDARGCCMPGNKHKCFVVCCAAPRLRLSVAVTLLCGFCVWALYTLFAWQAGLRGQFSTRMIDLHGVFVQQTPTLQASALTSQQQGAELANALTSGLMEVSAPPALVTAAQELAFVMDQLIPPVVTLGTSIQYLSGNWSSVMTALQTSSDASLGAAASLLVLTVAAVFPLMALSPGMWKRSSCRRVVCWSAWLTPLTLLCVAALPVLGAWGALVLGDVCQQPDTSLLVAAQNASRVWHTWGVSNMDTLPSSPGDILLHDTLATFVLSQPPPQQSLYTQFGAIGSASVANQQTVTDLAAAIVQTYGSSSPTALNLLQITSQLQDAIGAVSGTANSVQSLTGYAALNAVWADISHSVCVSSPPPVALLLLSTLLFSMAYFIYAVILVYLLAFVPGIGCCARLCCKSLHLSIAAPVTLSDLGASGCGFDACGKGKQGRRERGVGLCFRCRSKRSALDESTRFMPLLQGDPDSDSDDGGNQLGTAIVTSPTGTHSYVHPNAHSQPPRRLPTQDYFTYTAPTVSVGSTPNVNAPVLLPAATAPRPLPPRRPSSSLTAPAVALSQAATSTARATYTITAVTSPIVATTSGSGSVPRSSFATPTLPHFTPSTNSPMWPQGLYQQSGDPASGSGASGFNGRRGSSHPAVPSSYTSHNTHTGSTDGLHEHDQVYVALSSTAPTAPAGEYADNEDDPLPLPGKR